MWSKGFMLILIASLVFNGVNCFGQFREDPTAADLKVRLNGPIADTTRINLWVALGRTYLFKPVCTTKDVDSACFFMSEADNLSGKLKYLPGRGKATLLAAMIDNFKHNADKGLAESQKAFTLFSTIKDLKNMAECSVIIGQHFHNEGKDLDLKIGYYERAIALFRQTPGKDRLATTLKDVADLQIIANKNQLALQNLQEALSIYQGIGYKNLQGVYDLIGYDLEKMGDFINGLKYNLLAVKVVESVRDTTAQAGTIYYRTGFAYYMTKQYDLTCKFMDKALQIAEKYPDTSTIVVMCLSKSYALMKAGKYQSMLPLIPRLLKLKAFNNGHNMPIELSYLFMQTYLQVKQTGAAKKYFEKLKVLARKPDMQREIHEKALRGIIVYFQSTEQYEASYPYIKEHETFCRANNYKIFIQPEQLWLFRADSATGKYVSATRHYQKFKIDDDSIQNEKNSRQTALLNVQYETAKKDRDLLAKSRDIQLLEKKDEFQRTYIHQTNLTRNLIICVTVMLLITLAIGYNRYRLKTRNNLLLQAQQIEIYDQNARLQSFNARQAGLIREKEWLLREIHHRVKNNLQVTMSLLNIQSSYLANDEAIIAIRDSQRRIQAMSLIHQKLYQCDTLAYINMASYIPELVNNLAEGIGRDGDVTFDLDIANIELDISLAVPLALILNECITNSLKYAFPGGRKGQISILMDMDTDEIVRLQVKDDGVGLPEGFNHERSNSFGIDLVIGLTEQIDGSLDVITGDGTAVIIRFKQVRPMETELKIKEDRIEA